LCRALRAEWDDRDEPIVEIAAPEDFSGEDFWISAAAAECGGVYDPFWDTVLREDVSKDLETI